MNPRFRPKSNRGLWLALSGVVFALLLWHYRAVVLLLWNPDSWVHVLKDPAGAGLILGGIASGCLTIVAGLVTILVYHRQQRNEHIRNFFEWLTRMAMRYQQDSQFSEVRERLARERDDVRRLFCREMLWDQDLLESQILDLDRDYFKHDKHVIKREDLDWCFLRKFTDYLYFFEQVLAFGEVFGEHSADAHAQDLVNHFGWFLRSLCMSWTGPNASDKSRVGAQDLFVRYLAANRYRRLAEVALLLRDWNNPEARTHNNEVFDSVMKVLRQQNSGHPPATSYEELYHRWYPVIGNSGFVKH